MAILRHPMYQILSNNGAFKILHELTYQVHAVQTQLASRLDVRSSPETSAISREAAFLRCGGGTKGPSLAVVCFKALVTEVLCSCSFQ